MAVTVIKILGLAVLGLLGLVDVYAQSEIKAHWEVRNYYLNADSSEAEVFLHLNDGGQEKKVFVFYKGGSVSVGPESDQQWLVRYYNSFYGYHLIETDGSISIIETNMLSYSDRSDDGSGTEVQRTPITPGRHLSFRPPVTVSAKELYHRTLSLQGSRMNGDDVWALQRFLTEQNYPEIGEVYGWFGPNTEKAVKRFQSQNHFKADGVVNKAVWNALSGVEFGEYHWD